MFAKKVLYFSNLEYKPGFTIPYSSPEIFYNENHHFTTKSDVFSLGVMMFEILYNTFPYDIFEDTEYIDNIMESYLQKWYFAPEEFEMFGDLTVLRIMNGIISKCLAPIPSNRPELDWLALIIKQCF